MIYNNLYNLEFKKFLGIVGSILILSAFCSETCFNQTQQDLVETSCLTTLTSEGQTYRNTT